MAEARFTVGVFAGLIGPNGKLLLRRRTEEGSIIPNQSFRGNWELPGGGVMEQDSPQISYDLLRRELIREVIEEVDVKIDDLIRPMPPFYPAPFKRGNGYDLGLVTPIILEVVPIVKGDHLWVDPDELNQLAREFIAAKKDPPVEGKGLLSGYGKRMHCMALATLAVSNNDEYASQAYRTLTEIQESW